MMFASIGTKNELPPGNGPYSFWIHSQIYLLVSLLYPARQISQDMENFIFLILPMQQQNRLKTN
jgi:hypothetical protein